MKVEKFIGINILLLLVGFFFGHMVVQGRPIIKEEVTEIRCDKSKTQMDAEAAKASCGSYHIAEFEYVDNGKGENITPKWKCTD